MFDDFLWLSTRLVRIITENYATDDLSSRLQMFALYIHVHAIFDFQNFVQLTSSADLLLHMPIYILPLLLYLYYFIYRVSSPRSLHGSICGTAERDPYYRSLLNYRWVYQ